MIPEPKLALTTAISSVQQGRLNDAETQLLQLLIDHADHPQGLQLLGVVLAQLDRPSEALVPLQRSVELQPDDALARLHLSQVLALLGRDVESLVQLERSLELHPENVAGFVSHARAMMAIHQPLRALGSIERALTLGPDLAHAWQCRGEVLSLLTKAGMRRHSAAVESFRRAMELGGDSDELAFQLAVLGEGEAPPAVPASLVRRLFDAYAPKFEQHLGESLNYRTPQSMMQALLDAGVRKLLDEVWDLGCGTGLCAPLLRPMARRLIGVDLSPRMLAVAGRRNAYDELRCCDIVTSMEGRQSDIDLLVAADVLVYLGALEAFFGASRRALRAGGLLAFSLEALEVDSTTEFLLCATQRFAHNISYIERLAPLNGFLEVHRSRQILREESGQPVWGWIVVLERHHDD